MYTHTHRHPGPPTGLMKGQSVCISFEKLHGVPMQHPALEPMSFLQSSLLTTVVEVHDSVSDNNMKCIHEDLDGLPETSRTFQP